LFQEIVGTSAPLEKVLSRVSKVAPTDSSVLVTGETGTGKELVARAIHQRSTRCSRPFVSVNCAVVPRDLIASELFGHENGAFNRLGLPRMTLIYKMRKLGIELRRSPRSRLGQSLVDQEHLAAAN